MEIHPKKGEKLGLYGSNSEMTIYQNAVEFMEVDTEYNVEKEKEKGKFVILMTQK